MAEVPLDPSIAQISPNIASAIARAKIPPADAAVVKQLARTYSVGKDLLKKPKDDARKEFLELDPVVQENLRYIYSDQEIFKAEQNLIGKALSFTSDVVKQTGLMYFSPIVAGYKAVEAYAKGVNTPKNVLQQVRSGKQNFSKKVITDSFNGKNMWRQEDLALYEQKYGKALVTLARGLIEKRTPGEAIDLYENGIDDDMAAALKFMGDEPEKFDDVLADIQQNVQMSPGRNLSDALIQPMNSKQMAALKKNKSYRFLKALGIDIATTQGQKVASKVVSGPVDATYQLLNPTDPLTYVGIGPIAKAAVKGVGGVRVGITEALQFGGIKSRGDQLADQYRFLLNRFGESGVKQANRYVFQQADVRELWDGTLGPTVEAYAKATPGAERSSVYRRIRFEQPEWANEEIIKKMADFGVKDAKTAEKFFEGYENGRYLLSINVDGISYTRNGIPVAKKHRKVTSKLHERIYRVFNPLADDTASLEAVNKDAFEVIDELLKTGERENSLLAPGLDDLVERNKDRLTVLNKIGRAGFRSPGRILHGEDAIKTIDNVRGLLGQIVPRDVAEAVADLYIYMPPEQQITLIRNAHSAFYRRIGMHATPGGEVQANELLNATFNESAGMFNTVRSEIPKGWEKKLSSRIYKYENEIPVLQSRGAVHFSQLSKGIAPINYDMAYQYANQAKLAKKTNFINIIGGATRNNFLRKYTDFHVTQTLFPRLGIRTTVDEGIFYGMHGSYYDLLDLALGPSGTGKMMGDIATIVTGSKSGIGLYKRGVYKLFPHLDLTKKLPPEARIEIIKKLAIDNETTVENLTRVEIMQAIVNRAIQIYGETLPDKMFDSLKLIMKHNPSLIDAMAESLGSKSLLSGQVASEYMDSMFIPSAWTDGLREYGLQQSRVWTPREVSKMTNKQVAIAHFDNWNTRFSVNSKTVAKGVYINPVEYFFNHGGMRTIRQLESARNAILEKLGITFDESLKTFVSRGEKNYAKEFNADFSTTSAMRENGLSDIEITVAHIETMLLDMKNTFHGSATAFNETLFNLIQKKHKEIYAAADKKGNQLDTWTKAVASTTFKEFEDATIGYQPIGVINTRLKKVADKEIDMKVFEEFSGIDNYLQRYQNWSMDVMDAQVTGLLRQRLLWFRADQNLKKLRPFEENIRKDIIADARAANPNMDSYQLAILEKNAAAMAEKRVVTLAYENAMQDVLKSIDNQNVRSNLAMSVRSVARFYRATEDFQRRIYRIASKNSLRSLARMRLLYTGLQAHGDVYEDDKGDQYIIFPTDVIINSAVEPVLRVLTGNDNFQVPVFNDLALKLRLINPSFAPDAGQPSLSSPIASVTMLAIKTIANELPWGWSTRVSNKIDTIMLGNIGENLNLYNALVPMFGQSIIATSPLEIPGLPDDMSKEIYRQKASATIQAIAYFNAYGYKLPENATPEQKKKYLKDLKASATTIVAFRNMLGNIIPGQPSLKETKNVSDYVKRSGIGSPKAAFWDIYNSILRNGDTDIPMAWDLAVASFVGKYPGKAGYIVPRSNTSFNVFINKTNEVKNWAIDNKGFLNTYKEIGWLFAPRAGEYNPDVYGFLESQDLINMPDFEEYLDAVRLAEEKQVYFGIDDERDKVLQESMDPSIRKMAIDEASAKKRQMRNANPLLATSIENGLESQGELRLKLQNLDAALNNKKAPIRPQVRTSLRTIVDEFKKLHDLNNDVNERIRFDFTIKKAEAKDNITLMITELGKSSPEIYEASRLIFTPLLNTYSRESISAAARGE
jgi:hypothetical protein